MPPELLCNAALLQVRLATNPFMSRDVQM